MPNKTAKAYRSIKSLIEEGQLRDGQRVTEALASQLIGMARGPVRESLVRLEAEGLLKTRGAHHSRVVAYTEDQDPETMLHRYEMREQIEGGAARLAAKSMTGWEIDRLVQLARDLEQAWQGDGRQARFEAGRRFHHFLISKCGNPLLMQAWEAFHLAPTRPRSRKLDEQISTRIKQLGSDLGSFTAVAEAVASHEPEEAERLMKSRIRAVTDVIREIAMDYSENGRPGYLPDLGP